VWALSGSVAKEPSDPAPRFLRPLNSSVRWLVPGTAANPHDAAATFARKSPPADRPSRSILVPPVEVCTGVHSTILKKFPFIFTFVYCRPPTRRIPWANAF